MEKEKVPICRVCLVVWITLLHHQENGHSMGFDCQLALELSSMVLLIDKLNSDAITTRVAALKGLAAKETSPNGRNYYLTQVRILIGLKGKRNQSQCMGETTSCNWCRLRGDFCMSFYLQFC